jgi:hypothetical protein
MTLIENTGSADAVDVRVTFRFRKFDGAAILEGEAIVGTVRVGETRLFTEKIEGRFSLSSARTADYSITYSQGGPFTGTVDVS